MAAAALLARLFFICIHPLNYDGYWHVFIARHLPREVGALAHPPLYPLLLRLADSLRHTRLSYLSISLLSGVAAVVLFASVLGRIAERRESRLVGALALAFSPSAITLSGVAESYMLCTVFVLAATRAWLDLLAPAPAARPARSAIAFGAFGSLALLSHYAAGLFLLAAAAAPLALAVLDPEWRRAWQKAPGPRLAALGAAFLVPLAVSAALFRFLARPWVHRLSHVGDFYFAPARETLPAFFGRGLAGTFGLFSPAGLESPVLAAAALLAFLAAVTALALRADRRRGGSGPPAAAPAVLLVLLVGIEAAAGAAGWYPFGGAMRHQFLILLFSILAASVAFDRLLAGRSRAAGRVLVVFAAGAILGNWWVRLDRRWRPRPEPFSAERERFDRDFPDAREVHVDQFDLVGFFAQHHDWRWEFLGNAGAAHPSVERYRVSRNGRSIDVVAHRDLWTFDPTSPDLYRAIYETPAEPSSRAATLFGVRQALPGGAVPDVERLRRDIPALAASAGLETERLDVFDGGVFAQFGRVGVPPRTP